VVALLGAVSRQVLHEDDKELPHTADFNAQKLRVVHLQVVHRVHQHRHRFQTLHKQWDVFDFLVRVVCLDIVG